MCLEFPPQSCLWIPALKTEQLRNKTSNQEIWIICQKIFWTHIYVLPGKSETCQNQRKLDVFKEFSTSSMSSLMLTPVSLIIFSISSLKKVNTLIKNHLHHSSHFYFRISVCRSRLFRCGSGFDFNFVAVPVLICFSLMSVILVFSH